MNSGWVNGFSKHTFVGLPTSGLGSVSLFWYEGCFEWEGGRNGKINAVVTTSIWKISTVASMSVLFQGRGVSLPVCSRHHAKLILSCIQKSLKSDYLPVLEMWKMWPLPAAVEGAGCPENSHSPLLAPLLLGWGSCELFLNHMVQLLLECLKFIWVFSCLSLKSYTDSFYLK